MGYIRRWVGQKRRLQVGVLMLNMYKASWEKKDPKTVRRELMKLEQLQFAPGVNSLRATHKEWSKLLLEVRYS